MSGPEPDNIMGRSVQLERDEKVLARFTGDRLVYWKSHLVMAVVLGTCAGLFLLWQGNPFPVAGPVGALLAIFARAAYLVSEALGEGWTLTERRLIGPGGRIVPLSSLAAARPFLGAVQLVTRSGDKHLIKYLADPAATVSQILAAAGHR